MSFSRDSYYEKFKWDSVFRPVYKLVSIENKEKKAIAAVVVNSPKLEFLNNNPMTCRHAFTSNREKLVE